MNARRPEYYTRLLIYRSRQIILGIIILITSFFFALYIVNGLESEQHWIVIGIPLCLVGLGFIFFPATEKWEYKAWQAKPRKVEKNLDR